MIASACITVPCVLAGKGPMSRLCTYRCQRSLANWLLEKRSPLCTCSCNSISTSIHPAAVISLAVCCVLVSHAPRFRVLGTSFILKRNCIRDDENRNTIFNPDRSDLLWWRGPPTPNEAPLIRLRIQSSQPPSAPQLQLVFHSVYAFRKISC